MCVVGSLLAVLILMIVLAAVATALWPILGIVLLVAGVRAFLKRREQRSKHIGGKTRRTPEMPGQVHEETDGHAHRHRNGRPMPVDADVEDVEEVEEVTYERPYPESERVHYPEGFVYFDVDNGATRQTIVKRMKLYQNLPVVGWYARDVMDTFDSADFRRKTLLPEIDAKFAQGSLSWERFVSTATQALDAITRNCALLANRIQSFDIVEYQRYERFWQTGGFNANPDPGKSCLETWKLICDTKDEMDDISEKNDGLLLMLGRLGQELGKLTSSQTTDENSRIVDEISRLVDETKLYR